MSMPTGSSDSTPAAPSRAVRGSSAYRRIASALFLSGFATFSMLYCVQPLLPIFAESFDLTAAESSLAVSFSTGFLAVSILCAGALSEALGRKRLIFAALAGAALMNLAAAVAPSWPLLLLARALEGAALGGAPAVAMAYLAEEIDGRSIGFATGVYLSGSGFGGMAGRVLTAGIADSASWRVALAAIAVIGLAAAFLFLLLLPPSRHFTPRRGLGLRFHLATWRAHLRHSGLRRLFLIGFLIMGVFVTTYNYAAFHLLAPPFSLSQSSVGLIFTVYLVGVFASSVGGALGDRYGAGRIMQASLAVMGLGLLVALHTSLLANIAGIALVTLGFFGAHCMASSWVGRMAPGARGHAASLYLLIYYLGSSLLGTLGGWFWAVGVWPAVIAFMLVLTLVGLVAAARLPARAD